MKKVAFDMDDCLTSTWRQIFKYLELEFKINVSEPTRFYLTSDFLNPVQEKYFWDKYADQIYRYCPPQEGVREVLSQLAGQDYQIYVLTARQTYNETIEPMTREWFERNEIPYHHLYLNAGTKAEKCEELGIPLMVEDNPRNAQVLAKRGIQVLLRDQPYNQNISDLDVRRVHDWWEIAREIDRFYAFGEKQVVKM